MQEFQINIHKLIILQNLTTKMTTTTRRQHQLINNLCLIKSQACRPDSRLKALFVASLHYLLISFSVYEF